MRQRGWLVDHDAETIIAAYADRGFSLSRVVEQIAGEFQETVSRGAISAFAARNGIEFRGKQPQWTRQRRANHKAGMRKFWENRKKQ